MTSSAPSAEQIRSMPENDLGKLVDEQASKRSNLYSQISEYAHNQEPVPTDIWSQFEQVEGNFNRTVAACLNRFGVQTQLAGGGKQQ